MATSSTRGQQAQHPEADPQQRADLEDRVHVDLPRVRPEEMVTTQQVTPAKDPRGGRDTENDFVLRHGF